MILFDNPDKYLDKNYNNMTSREQEEVLNQISLFEARVHKTLGVKFKEIVSSTNFKKSI